MPSYTVVAGLGGRPITAASLDRMLDEAVTDELDDLNFLDLDIELVTKEIQRESKIRRSGPIPENLIRDVGVARATAH